MLKKIIPLLVTINCAVSVYSQYTDLEFDHITTSKGLSDREVRCITQDYKGFIWAGTSNGLNKFDGNTFTVYKNDSTDKNSLSHNYISCILEDSKKRLWICTGKGLNLYNREKDQFTSFVNYKDDSTSIGNDRVMFVFEDREGDIWVGHYEGFAKIIISENNRKVTFKNYYPVKTSSSLQKNWIFCIGQDREGLLWLGSMKNGAYRFNKKTEEIINFHITPYDSNNTMGSWIKRVFLDNDSNLWFLLHATHGLARYDETSDGFINYRLKDENGRNDGSINTFSDVKVDKNNLFWLATDYGLQIYNYKTGTNTGYVYSPDNPKGIGFLILRSVFVDKNSALWIGTKNGIDYSDNNIPKYKVINVEKYPLLGGNLVTSLAITSRDEIFMSIYKKGMCKYIPEKESLSLYHIDCNKCIANESSDVVYASYAHENNRIYFYDRSKDFYKELIIPEMGEAAKASNSEGDMCFINSNGLYFYDTKKASIRNFYPQIREKVKYHNFISLFFDKYDTLWIVSMNNLYKWNNSTGELTGYSNNKMDYNIYSRAQTICNKNGNLWMNYERCILYFERKTGIFIEYGQKDGLDGDLIYSIILDAKDNLWVSTNKGISKFDATKKRFTNLGEEDGLPDLNFNYGLSCRDSKGNLYFGSNNGILVINPENIKTNKYVPPIVLTGFKLFNKIIAIRPDSIKDTKRFYLEKQINETNEIVLKYNQNVITIEFAALNYTNPSKNQYAYYLEGLEEKWNYVGNQKFANYSGLQPGTYVFKVKGSNNNNIWNEKGLSLKIVILPPFWQTWWFRLICTLMVLFSFFLYFRIRLSVIKKQKRELEITVQQRTAEVVAQKEEIEVQADNLKQVNTILQDQQAEIQAQSAELLGTNKELQKLNATKDKFFSIIGHDLKNPMHAIHGLAEILDQNGIAMEKEQQQEIFTMLNNASNSVTVLLENLLTWARSQSNRVEFKPEFFELGKIAEETLQVLKVNADNKGIKLISEVAKGTMIYADQNMITTVVRNLVNNAIKFTQQGSITVKSEAVDNKIKISVIDTGVGMNEETRNKLFQIDVHHSTQGTSGEGGTGLGLIICKEFVEKNNGHISVESEPEKGSRFIVLLPRSEDTDNTQQTTDNAIEVSQHEIEKTEHRESLIITEETETNVSEKPIVLIAEDTPVMRANVKNLLEPKYKILEAVNGKEAIKLAMETIPDLIISDWMMPEMDGMEFCKQIKSDERTSHVPIIMLTARAASKDKVEGFETGADEYLTKPFDKDILIARVKNLIATRKKLQEKFSSAWMSDQKEAKADLSPIDDQFINKMEDVTEKNISDIDFDVVKLCREIGMSHTQLYRKLMALTNLSPTLFIRNFRLKKAAELLSQKNSNVSEVLFSVGFNHKSYFTKCFKEVYGVLPSDYKKKVT